MLAGLNETKWKKIFKLPSTVTQNTKLQWLQYRINQRILGTNTFLYKIRVKDNAFSTFCQEDEETIEHLFWNCETVQAFIDEIDSWLLSNGVSIPFTMQFFSFWWYFKIVSRRCYQPHFTTNKAAYFFNQIWNAFTLLFN
jgi:hypothetical protein